MTHSTAIALAAGTACAILNTTSLMASPALYNIGVLPGDTNSLAMDVSADGSSVAGISGEHAIRWTPAGGLENLAPGMTAHAYAISADGNAITGDIGSSVASAFIWRAGVGVSYVPSMGTSHMAGRDITPDGTTIVGWGMTPGLKAFRYNETDGVQDLGGVGDHVAYGVKADGATVVGYNGGLTPRRWTAGDGWIDLSVLAGGTGVAKSVSADGIVAGWSSLDASVYHAVRWDAAGQIFDLGTLETGGTSNMERISDDGSTIVGTASVASSYHATLWTAELGLVDLNTYLPTLGIDLSGWVLTETRGVSADGLVLSGFGQFEGQQRGWVAYVPEPASLGGAIVCATLLRRRRA